MLQAISCFFLTGLIWTIQLVHYPSFQWVEDDKFTMFAKFHSARISILVVPAMLIELVTAVMLIYTPTPLLTSRPVLLMNVAGVVFIWISTFLFSVPCHSKFKLGTSKKLIFRLVATNWPRTIIWSLRSLLWFVIIKRSLLV